MSRLFLHCGLCGRKQADGLLSRNSWGHVEGHTPPLRACPGCRSTHSDWADRLVAIQDGRVGAVYGVAGESRLSA
jgi:hypothetical protein